jgi:hypothetical protein
LSETTDQAAVVCDGVELDSCLDAAGVSMSCRVAWRDLHIDRGECTVGD